MTPPALLAVLLAAVAGLLAGRAWAAALRRDELRRPPLRASPHYLHGMNDLSAGRRDRAASELAKAVRDDPDALDLQLVLGNLSREAGQVERAIQVHQGILAREGLVRAERASALVALGADYQKAGFLDRAMNTFEAVLEVDPKNLPALIGIEKLHEEQRAWREAYAVQVRIARLRKSDDRLVLGYLQAEVGLEALRAGRLEEAEKAFESALGLDRRVFTAHLGLADLYAAKDPRRAATILEEAVRVSPDRAYLVFDRLARAYADCGEASRFVDFCEGLIQSSPRDWRARIALARHLRSQGRPDEAYGLILRAMEANPQALLAHLEMWKTLSGLGAAEGEPVERYVAAAEESVFYAAPHVCTACRYRADEMLWRCPQCHEWNTFVEERLGPPAADR